MIINFIPNNVLSFINLLIIFSSSENHSVLSNYISFCIFIGSNTHFYLFGFLIYMVYSTVIYLLERSVRLSTHVWQ
ncbi:hypothetical protein YC2023_060967 [Brassica napus]|uniref:Uncharacterized protein n=1 Tax=Brassica oleracea var. oleracea TaxID=109376 RepID=A0A0D3CH21_BRAOL